MALMGKHGRHKKLDEPEIESTVPIQALRYTNHIPMRWDIHWLVGIFLRIQVALMGPHDRRKKLDEPDTEPSVQVMVLQWHAQVLVSKRPAEVFKLRWDGTGYTIGGGNPA